MGAASVQQMADRVAQLLHERLAIRGEGLAAKLENGGRRLPRQIRREAAYLAESAARAADPQQFMRLDHPRISLAYDACLRYLTARPPRRGWVVALRAALWRVAVVLVMVSALALAFAAWRGLL